MLTTAAQIDRSPIYFSQSSRKLAVSVCIFETIPDGGRFFMSITLFEEEEDDEANDGAERI